MLYGNVAMRRVTVRLLVSVVLYGVYAAAGWTEAAPQVDQWHHPNDALFPVDLMHRVCERDCASEPSYLCDFYVCDEEREPTEEVEDTNEHDSNTYEDDGEETEEEEEE
uniref:Uncharacterized protein n=1 Tax=Anopheles culicifacies TaxID=139723 RepID=A0A182MUU1_9DIPT